ncbi:RHS repeat-associated core domain-containing protein [Stenotrophomonas sp. SY1]|uniref:RHS repeat-associated core domain-containing protein n=1 Tax=Stenotrophomonas sp. SY1 TaxID=477235 RepID=UPI001E4E520B|nr:RHS repeat-associated core domain-containing protein [Stenotrophomonas sp. SY1]MCD9088698.1 hypothetical protein [Stenotrophomonas sp. SY1]
MSTCAWMLAALLPLVAQAQTTVEYIHTDPLGSPVAVTDAGGNVIEREIYEPYGSPIKRPPSDQPGFTGHVSDSLTNLTYMQQRYYDQQIGRFLSVDPVTAYSNPVGAFNRYWYANDNPYRFNDSDGRETGAAFRTVNNLTNGGPVNRPPRSPDDKLGPVIGYALGGILAAPAVGYVGAAALANPATANTVMTAAADLAIGDAIGGASLAASATTLYRVVDGIELDSIRALGTFSASPNGDTVKRFLGNLPDAQALRARFEEAYGVKQYVVEGRASSEVMSSTITTRFSDVPGRPMDSINVRSEDASKVVCNVQFTCN